jgi:type IX secretion system PorP/SprF family membrane protein
MKTTIQLFILLFFRLSFALAQDPYFSQSYSSSLLMNPAFAGAFEYPVVSVGYRNQWPALTGNYITEIASYNQFINKISSGIGFYYLHDSQGEETLITHSFHLDFSPSFTIAKDFILKPAVEFAHVSKKVDWDKLTFGDIIDSRYGFVYPTAVVKPNSSISFFDFSTGLLVYHKYFDAGFALHHPFEPEEYFIQAGPGSKVPMQTTIHGSVNIPLNEEKEIFICPDFIYMKQRDFRNEILNLNLKFKAGLIGMGLTENNSIIFAAGFQTKSVRLSYSYDETVSNLAGATAGSHEIFFSFYIRNERLKSKMQPMNRIAF